MSLHMLQIFSPTLPFIFTLNSAFCWKCLILVYFNLSFSVLSFMTNAFCALFDYFSLFPSHKDIFLYYRLETLFSFLPVMKLEILCMVWVWGYDYMDIWYPTGIVPLPKIKTFPHCSVLSQNKHPPMYGTLSRSCVLSLAYLSIFATVSHCLNYCSFGILISD